MTEFNFLKAHGLGNDFVIFFEQQRIIISDDLIKSISNRKTGIGCDLVAFVNQSKNNYSDLTAKFLNKDGSEEEICGNALRCIGKHYFQEKKKNNVTIETMSGLIYIEDFSKDSVIVDLGKPNLEWDKIPIKFQSDTKNLGINLNYLKDGFALNVGNPHVIFFVKDINEKHLESDSKELLSSGLFPQGANISIVEIVSQNQIKTLTFERGVGITQACGSGAGASVFASNKMNCCNSKVKVIMNGGKLDVEITKDDHILTIGDAKQVFEGKIELKDESRING